MDFPNPCDNFSQDSTRKTLDKLPDLFVPNGTRSKKKRRSLDLSKSVWQLSPSSRSNRTNYQIFSFPTKSTAKSEERWF